MITALDKQTALVLIDLQNSILQMQLAHDIDEVLSNANELIDAFHEKRLPVVLVNVNTNGAKWVQARKDAAPRPPVTDPKMWQIADVIHAEDQDIRITKHTWNAFFETALHEELQQRGVTGIVLGGVASSIGVEGTARGASELGYNISFAIDAMADIHQSAHDHSVQHIFPRMGEVGRTADILKELGKE